MVCAHFSRSSGMPGVAFPGQAIDRRDVDATLGAHAGAPLAVALLRRAGVGSVAELDFADTRIGQPATYVAGLLRAWHFLGVSPDVPVTLGHSLGEITALAFAGVIDPMQGLDLMFELGEVGHHQELMRASALVVLMGLPCVDVDWVIRLAVARTSGVLEASGFNGPHQTIVCGDRKAAEAAAELAIQHGGRATLLPIRGAYHSSLMVDLLDRWGVAVRRVDFAAPKVPVVSSVDITCRRSAGDVTDLAGLLTRWLLLPVRWADAVTAAGGTGACALWDAGPGEILRGLGKRGSALPYVRVTESE